LKLVFLGTGRAQVTECYNTCFITDDSGKLVLTDGGGGIYILHQLKAAGYRWQDIGDIIVTHKHMDHLLGVMWIVRMIAQSMKSGKYKGEARIYGHDEVLSLIKRYSDDLLTPDAAGFVGDRIVLREVHDGEKVSIQGRDYTFFDIHSTKAKQYGYTFGLPSGGKLTCCGDEPYTDFEKKYAEGAVWLLHEAFCLKSDADRFKPYEKHHSTVADAAENAESLGVKNLVLYHTEDTEIAERKKLYTEEASRYFGGRVYVPDDLEEIKIG
jgi:ribonuclease Z